MRNFPGGQIIAYALFHELPILGWIIVIAFFAIVFGGIILSGVDTLF